MPGTPGFESRPGPRISSLVRRSALQWNWSFRDSWFSRPRIRRFVSSGMFRDIALMIEAASSFLLWSISVSFEEGLLCEANSLSVGTFAQRLRPSPFQPFLVPCVQFISWISFPSSSHQTNLYSHDANNVDSRKSLIVYRGPREACESSRLID